MTPMQILILVLFGLVTFANTFIIQPDITWSPMVHAGVVSLDVTLFWLALNLQRFSDLGAKAEITVPAAPIDAIPPTVEPAPEPAPVAPTAPPVPPVPAA